MNLSVLRVPHLKNPSFRLPNPQRTFHVQDYGDLDGSTGEWATEEEASQEGVVQEFEDDSWIHDEASDAWVARHFGGGQRLVNGSRQGKREGTRTGKLVNQKWNTKEYVFRSSLEVQ